MRPWGRRGDPDHGAHTGLHEDTRKQRVRNEVGVRVMKPLIVALMLGAAGSASAQFKCVSPGGGVSFQQMPCAGSARGERMTIRPASGEAPVTMPATAGSAQEAPRENVDVRMAREMGQERRIREAREDIDYAERAMTARANQMEAELQALRQRKSLANNNLAGATWEQSISSEMNAVAQKYKNINDIQAERLKVMRAELAKLEAGK